MVYCIKDRRRVKSVAKQHGNRGWGAPTPVMSLQRKDFAMGKLHCFILVIAFAIAVFAGCSEDQIVSPHIGTPSLDNMAGALAVIGPSEIVMCVDVSDSISADELTSMVDAMSGCLSNAGLVPRDGLVSIALLVYGDTISALLADPVPVTDDNLDNVILPALQGLLSDRIVGGDGADLSGALEAAAEILGAATVTDLHVLVLGSGAADDPAAVETACQALGDAGVMISAIGVGPDPEGAALLEGCADMTGGFFGAGDTDLESICSEALAYMLQVMVDLEPESADLPRLEDHTVTATVFRGGDSETYPVSGLDVTIAVIDGPNMSETITAPTDTHGVVSFTYNGDGGPGTDVIVASANHPGTGSTMTDTVMVTWLNAPPVCDAGGPYVVIVTSDTAHVTLDAGSSSDAEDDSLRFYWSAACEGVWLDDDRSITPVLTITGDCLCVDSLTIDLVVSDGYDSTTCAAVVHIDDQRPPIIVVRDEPLLMWPPNHKRREITPDMMIVSAEDACGNPIDIFDAVVMEVRSDEPEDGNGDGRTLEDIRVLCPNVVHLRAERAGGGNGRVYTIVYSIVAENGVAAEAEATVIVPHDSSDDTAIEDEFGGYTVIPECGDE